MKTRLLKIASVFLVLMMCTIVTVWSTGGKDPGGDAVDRPTITFYHMIGGIAYPHEDFDPDNNPVINWINDTVGVKLELSGPQVWAEAQTETNLLIASGNLPDIMHSGWMYPALDDAATQGTFVDLKPYWEKSRAMQKHCTADMLAQCKAPDGKNYRIPIDQRRGWQIYYNIVRLDLIEEIYGGKMPTTIDEWVDFFRAVKNKYPEAAVLILANEAINLQDNSP